MENRIIDKNYKNIKLESLKGLFAYQEKTLSFLKDNGVVTVEDILLEKHKNIPEDKYSSFGEETSTLIKHDIDIAEKLLECKYLGIDPSMNINMYDNIYEVGDVLGFSSRTTNCLGRELSYQEFIDIIKLDRTTAFDKLAKCRNLGKHALEEILFKTPIVLKYYNSIEKEKNVSIDESMYLEFLELSKQVKALDKRIDSILEKMNIKQSSEDEKTYVK